MPLPPFPLLLLLLLLLLPVITYRNFLCMAVLVELRQGMLANNIPQMRWMWILLYYFPVESYLEWWRWSCRIPSFLLFFHPRIVELCPPSDTVSPLTHAASKSSGYVLVVPLTKLSIAAKFITFLLGVNRKVPSPKLLSIQLRARGGDKNKNGTSKSTEK